MSPLRSHVKVDVQGPRPADLMIRKETRRIQKTARKPVIVYMVSPKIIHAEAGEFMALVQRLTGLPAASRPTHHHQSSPGISRQFPVRVKARVLTQDPAVSPNPMHLHSSPFPSPLGIGARKEGGSQLASQSLPLRGDYPGQGRRLPAAYLQDTNSEADQAPGHCRYELGVGELFFWS